MAQKISEGSLAALVKFFALLAENDRVWPCLRCAFNMEDEFKRVKDVADADAWLMEFLTGPKRPRVRFSRLIHLLAFLDFELSPLAISRLAARAMGMTKSEHEFIVKEGQQMLDNMVPRMSAMVDAWKDVRSNELDEAALWVFRDESERQELAERPTRFR